MFNVILKNNQALCKSSFFHSLNLREFRFAQTMIFAIEEINSSDYLLPNVSIGYRIYDNCGSTLSSMRAAMALMNGAELTLGRTCSGQSPVHAIIGESESSSTIVLSRTTGPFKIPVVGGRLHSNLYFTENYSNQIKCPFIVLFFFSSDQSLSHM